MTKNCRRMLPEPARLESLPSLEKAESYRTQQERHQRVMFHGYGSAVVLGLSPFTKDSRGGIARFDLRNDSLSDGNLFQAQGQSGTLREIVSSTN